MKAYSYAKTKGTEGRRTAAEIDAFFTRLSTPKYIKGLSTPKFLHCLFSQVFTVR